MESLESILKFTERYPQITGSDIQYSFTGGIAVRLSQEKSNYNPKREISDIDIVVFKKGNKYPVHSFYLGGHITDNLTEKELLKYVVSIKIGEKKIFYMDGSFLAAAKTCSIDLPRDKDYRDIKILHDSGEIDLDKLENLFSLSPKIKSNEKSAVSILFELMMNQNKENEKIFQAFPYYVSLLSKFKEPYTLKNLIGEYVSKNAGKHGYAIGVIIFNLNKVIDLIKDSPNERKLEIVKELLDESSQKDHIQFGQFINEEYILKLKSKISSEENL